MEMGISTASFYPTLLEDALEQLVTRQVPVAELFLNTFSELNPPLRQTVRAWLDCGSTRAISVHPFTSVLESSLFFTSYSRRFEDGVELYRRYFDYAAQMGAKILVFHGNHRNTSRPPQRYYERFARLRQAAKETGIILAQENVFAHCSQDLPFLVEMRRYLHDEVEFVLDNKQALRGGQDPMEMAKALGERVVHLHLSDSVPGKDCLPPGEGSFDFHQYFSILKEKGYSGDGVIELYHNSYESYQQIFASREYLQKKADQVFFKKNKQIKEKLL